MLEAKIESSAKSKTLALGLLLAALMAASLMLTAKPAQAAKTFTVNNTSDVADLDIGDGACDGFAEGSNFCSLRAAIQEANASPGADAINFDIGGESRVKTISPSSELPTITEALTIDGYTQPGAVENSAGPPLLASNANLLIQLDGKSSGTGTDGLVIKGSNIVVRGLVISNFRDSGVRIEGSGADRNKLEGNFIGTDPTGTVDAGNANDGVSLGGGASAGGGGSDNRIGGLSPAAFNVISGNENFGVRLFSGSVPTSENTVEGNLIGTSKDGASALGNGDEGVSLGVFASDNTVSVNTIAHNGGAGVTLSEFNGTGDLRGNRIQSNSIFSNRDLGIDLGKDGRTANDAAPDADEGPNGLQNFPALNSAANSDRGTTVEGEFQSTPNASFAIELFSNPQGEDEGTKFAGKKEVTTNANGVANFETVLGLAVLAGQSITATATNTATGDTSEFSEPIEVTRSNVAPVANDDAFNAKKAKKKTRPLNIPAPGLLKNDSDPDGDALTAELVSNPANGTLKLNANGSFSYTPNKKFKGPDSFVYRASDGKGGTDKATVTITVGKEKKK